MKKLDYWAVTAQNPTLYKTMTNQIGQEVKFYEHPTLGDVSCVLACIEQTIVETEFFDTEDFYENSDYLPILHEGEIYCHFVYTRMVG